jgi:hypothetical protein
MARAPVLNLDLTAAWNPYDRQARFIECDRLFVLFLAGVGSGKSHSLARWLVRKALLNGRHTGCMFGRTGPEIQTNLLPALESAFEQLHAATGIDFVADHNRGKAYFLFINGGKLYYRPYDKIGKVRSLTLTYAGVDEVEWSEADPGEIWTVMTGRLRGKGPYPGMAFATSPNGNRGITKRFVDAQRAYAEAERKGDAASMRIWSDYYVVTATSYDNPFNPPHFYTALRSMNRRKYEQEALGKVLQPLSSIYEISERHLVTWDWRQHRRMPWVCCVDWGTNCHHVALMVQVQPDGTWVVADELVCDDMPQNHFLSKLFAWVDAHGLPALFCVDRAVPRCNTPLTKRYSDPSIPVRWMESKEEQAVALGIEAVRDMLDPYEGPPRLLFARSLANVAADDATAPIRVAMRGYRYVMGHDGIPTDRIAKDNIHDHAPDALRYGVVGSSNRFELHGGRRWIVDVDSGRRPEFMGPEHRGPGHSLPQT